LLPPSFLPPPDELDRIGLAWIAAGFKHCLAPLGCGIKRCGGRPDEYGRRRRECDAASHSWSHSHGHTTPVYTLVHSS
jgi:hypothetical protein